ncbi:MAG TPA: 4-hydroxy-tetrahydrodipicolinate reductase [bacterium]|nr:4-hydroxy-tetrahydrodipicolinate reductase [bacterium]
MIKIGIAGAFGRMGQAIAALVEQEKEMKLALALEAKGSGFAGKNICGCIVTDDLKKGSDGIDVLIDFTTPSATVENIKILAGTGKAAVIGTTGLDDNEMYEIKNAASRIPVVYASNYSVGVNVMWKIIRDAVSAMKADYDIDIVESHHRMKKDAPSGTAVTTAQVILGEKGLDYASNVVFGREGRENERPRNQLGVLAVRGGGVIGEHTVILASMADKLEVKHTSFSRDTFAAGALKAAAFIKDKKPGLYSMKDVLGI